jgi:hypothetical protein
MIRLRTRIAGLMTLTLACSSLTGCSDQPSGTDLPVGKPATQEEIKESQKKVMDGMKTDGGMYKGAPGVPLKTR